MVDESRSVVFGRDADAYDDARPEYPDEAIAHILALTDPVEVVEVGAGTGKATMAIAREGMHLVCLEPSERMAEVLEQKQLPGVEVVVSTFERWEGTAESLDLIYAAQAWHWVDRETGLAKALGHLRSGGALALMWNIPLDRYSRHEDLYRTHAPGLLDERDERIKRRDSHDWGEEMEDAGYVDIDRFTVPWDDVLTAREYRTLYSTYSDHIMLDEPHRTSLLDGLEAEVNAWGGTATIQYRTEVFSGRKT